MSDRPSEIWCKTGLYWNYVEDWSEGSWWDNGESGGEKYVRAARIEELEGERDEALNQLDSARHSISVLEKRAKTFCDGWGIADKGRIEAEAKLAKAVKALEFLDENYRLIWGVTARAKMRTTLAELKGETDE